MCFILSYFQEWVFSTLIRHVENLLKMLIGTYIILWIQLNFENI